MFSSKDAEEWIGVGERRTNVGVEKKYLVVSSWSLPVNVLPTAGHQLLLLAGDGAVQRLVQGGFGFLIFGR